MRKRFIAVAFQSPLKRGARFSMNADTPSLDRHLWRKQRMPGVPAPSECPANAVIVNQSLGFCVSTCRARCKAARDAHRFRSELLRRHNPIHQAAVPFPHRNDQAEGSFPCFFCNRRAEARNKCCLHSDWPDARVRKREARIRASDANVCRAHQTAPATAPCTLARTAFPSSQCQKGRVDLTTPVDNQLGKPGHVH